MQEQDPSCHCYSILNGMPTVFIKYLTPVWYCCAPENALGRLACQTRMRFFVHTCEGNTHGLVNALRHKL